MYSRGISNPLTSTVTTWRNSRKTAQFGLIAIVAVLAVTAGWGISIPSATPPAYLIWIIICWGGGAAIIFYWYQGEDRVLLLKLFTLGFSARLVLAAVIYFQAGWVYPDGSGVANWVYPDAKTYVTKAVRLAEIWRSGEVLSLSQLVYYSGGMSETYTIFNAIPLFIFEGAVLTPVITNCFLGSIIPVGMFRFAMSVFGRRVARISAYFIAFSPSLLYWSAVNLKELSAAFLLCGTMLGYLSLRQRVTVPKLVLTLLGLTILLFVRIYMVVLLALAWLVSNLLEGRQFEFRRSIQEIVMVLVLFGLLWGVVGDIRHVQIFRNNITRLVTLDMSLFELSTAQASLAAEKGFFMGQFRGDSQLTWLINAAHFMTSPSPYRPKFGLIDIVRVGTIFWYLLLPYFVFGTYYSLRYRGKAMLPIIVFVYGVIAAYAPLPILSSVRHRAQIMPFAFLIAAAGLVKYDHQHKRRFACLMWAGLFIGVALLEFI